MSGPFGSSQWMYATGAAEGQSLRFNDDDSAFLSRTPSTASNRKTWTWSGWVKRGNLSTNQQLFSSYPSTGNATQWYFRSTDNSIFFMNILCCVQTSEASTHK